MSHRLDRRYRRLSPQKNCHSRFEAQDGVSRQTVEWVMNHIHPDGLQNIGCQDIQPG
jgi:hypothetical protein